MKRAANCSFITDAKTFVNEVKPSLKPLALARITSDFWISVFAFGDTVSLKGCCFTR